MAKNDFFSIYTHGFARVAVCVVPVRVADPMFNVVEIESCTMRAHKNNAVLVAFPELCLSGYSCDDLFHQQPLIEGCLKALERLVRASIGLRPIILAGSPIFHEGKLFNCAVVIHNGRVLGVVPKTYLPNYREFYEKRQFSSALHLASSSIMLFDQTVPFGNDLIFCADGIENLKIGAEICEDLWSPIPPSTVYALAGANVLVNLSASNVTMGKADYRKMLVQAQSGSTISAYLYCSSGEGESTTDLAWDGHAMICENGTILSENERFSGQSTMIFSDIDLERLAQDRIRHTAFNDTILAEKERVNAIRQIHFSIRPPQGSIALERTVARFPYVPATPETLDRRCEEVYQIQVQGLATRMRSAGITNLVIGVSGGLDSTHALMVAVKTMAKLGLPAKNIYGYSMPGFATSERTSRNASNLMNSLGITAAEIDIRPSCFQMLKDIRHPFADGRPIHDVTFENVQAGERTSHLFRLANLHNAMVPGTGDLSELALGWCTYGVGDHMSHYNVNASVPKTLIQHLIRWSASRSGISDQARKLLESILSTEISPELVPGDTTDGQPAQSTQQITGPYELQDFNLYYVTRFGFRPSKVAFLAHHAWSDRNSGIWPGFIEESRKTEYDLPQIKKWLRLFLKKFFGNTQFKRSCVPNGPKVGSGGSLSPRGDWRAPSDSSPNVWLEELDTNTP